MSPPWRCSRSRSWYCWPSTDSAAGLLRPRRSHDDCRRHQKASLAAVCVGRRVRGSGRHHDSLRHLSIEQNIGYGLSGLSPHDRRHRVAGIAESFRITDILGRKPAHVSGGERQRAALARALVTDPSLLLLDEPLSALDHAIQSRIMDDLRRSNEARRIPVLYVTHSHREAFALGDRVVVLENGRLLAAGSPHEVLDHPSHGVLASLAGF